jgi:hypothetical protein
LKEFFPELIAPSKTSKIGSLLLACVGNLDEDKENRRSIAAFMLSSAVCFELDLMSLM